MAQTLTYTGTETSILLPAGTYDFTVYGAQGGTGGSNYSYSDDGPVLAGGLGAEMEGQFTFATEVNLTILVGGAGGTNPSGFVPYYTGGGGGGTFVVDGSSPLIIAGGGGGSTIEDGAGLPGLTTTSGGAGGAGGGAGGTGGSGGGSDAYQSAGGGGYSGNGGSNGATSVYAQGGSSFINGGAGGTGGSAGGTSIGGTGGFGGGGGGDLAGGGGGGGGGYSGGGGGYNNAGGGGGGSYIDAGATSLVQLSGVQTGNGEVVIAAVPEPATWILLLGGMCLLWALGRIRARRA